MQKPIHSTISQINPAVERGVRLAGEPKRRLLARPPTRLPLAAAGLLALIAGISIAVTQADLPPRVRLEQRAATALSVPGHVLRVVLRITSDEPAVAATSVRMVWLDLHRRTARWEERDAGGSGAQTLVEPGGFTTWREGSEPAFVGAPCGALADGCFDVVDPVMVYWDALRSTQRRNAGLLPVAARGSDVLLLPARVQLRALRVEQVIRLDRRTHLPSTIEWRALGLDGLPRTILHVTVERIEQVARGSLPHDAFTFRIPPGTGVRGVPAPEKPLLVMERRELSIAAAKKLSPPLLWLGESFGGWRVGHAEEIRSNAGVVFVFRYGPVTVWNAEHLLGAGLFGGGARTAPGAPTLVRPGGRRFYATEDGRLVAALRRGHRQVAITARDDSRAAIVALADSLRPLR